jgi:hypothetical protein
MERRQRVFYWVLASAALMLVGAFGPWAKIFGFSVNGTDGSNDGWLVVLAAVVSAALLLWKRDARIAGLGAIAGGAVGALVTIYDRQNLTPDSADGELVDGLVQVGWGLNLAMLASISLAVAGVVWMRSAGTESPEAAPDSVPTKDPGVS